MLPGGKHVLSVWADLLPHAHKGMLFIDSSTIDVDRARRVHELAGSAGVLSIDAPVSGGTAGAKGGTLTFMCGAEEAALAAAKPIIEKMGKKIILCGETGAGQAAKICNNMILGVTMIETAEAFVLAEKLGLSHQALFNVASTSSGRSWSLTSYCPVPEWVRLHPPITATSPDLRRLLC
jgi:3-hydroxyisobutyrate dehydrogenase